MSNLYLSIKQYDQALARRAGPALDPNYADAYWVMGIF